MARNKIVILTLIFLAFSFLLFLLFLPRKDSMPEKSLIHSEYVTDVSTSSVIQEETKDEIETTQSGQIQIDESTSDKTVIENSEINNKIGTKIQKKYTTTSGYLTDFSSLINALLYGSFIISVLLSFSYIVWGGLDWIVSGGDKEKISSAVQKIVCAVVGLIIVSSSFAIISYLLHFLGVDSLINLMKVL